MKQLPKQLEPANQNSLGTALDWDGRPASSTALEAQLSNSEKSKTRLDLPKNGIEVEVEVEVPEHQKKRQQRQYKETTEQTKVLNQTRAAADTTRSQLKYKNQRDRA